MELPYREVNLPQLNIELQKNGLPIKGTATLARRFVDGKWQSSEAYLLVKGDFTPIQEQAIRDVVAAHVPLPPEPTAQELDRARAKELLAKGLSGMTVEERDEAMKTLGRVL